MDDSNFDFQSLTQEDEQLNFDKLLPCPHCKKPIPHDATMCLYCGEGVGRYKKPLWLVWTAVSLIIIFVLFILFVI